MIARKMSATPHEQAMQSAYQLVTEHFPNAVIVAEAQFLNPEGQPQFTQLMRWYGCTTTALGLITFASDRLCFTFAGPAAPQQQQPPSAYGEDAPPPPPPQPAPMEITAIQEESLQRALKTLSGMFICAIIVAQGEPELAAKGERSLKVIRCNGPHTMVAGLSVFATNALRRKAQE